MVGRRQVFDLPEPRLEVTEHQLGQIECCGRVQRGEYPPYVTANVQYGPGVRALVTKLSVNHKMPLEQICCLFQDLFGYELNTETVEQALEEGYELAAPVEAEIREALKQADVTHFDETGLRAAGKLRWMHTASTAEYTRLFVHPKRGEEALRSAASVLKDFTGRAIHDHMSAYYKFSQAKHGACNAHTAGTLRLDGAGPGVGGSDARFLVGTVPPGAPLTRGCGSGGQKRYRQILSQAEMEEPSPEPRAGRGRPKSTPGRNLLRRLR